MASSRNAPKRVILWFRKDLRIHDNILLSNNYLKNCQSVTPIYIFDPREFGESTWMPGFQKQSSARVKFLLESVQCLKNSLRNKLGSDLLIFRGLPEEIIPDLCSKQAATVLVGSEVAHYERQTEKILKAKLLTLDSALLGLWDRTLLHPDDINLHALKLNGFTGFRKAVERNWRVRALHKTPAKLLPLAPLAHNKGATKHALATVPALLDFGLNEPSRDDRMDINWIGGENNAISRLETFVDQGLAKYKSTRNELCGANYSSKMSAWLALGCISPKKIYWRVQKYEQQNEATEHTYWITFEMLWRDYFHFLCFHSGAPFFYEYGPKNDKKIRWISDAEKFKKWANGETGVPLVDACMRQLKLTGYMSNRGRQNVASYLVLDLKLDWRLGASHFEEYLLDHDCAVNYGNWLAAANLLGGRMNRFNCVKQGKDYDPHGKFIKRFCPELSQVASKFIHDPSSMNSTFQRAANCIIGKDYPKSMTKIGWNNSGNSKRRKKRKPKRKSPWDFEKY